MSGNEPPIELEAIGRFLEEQACTGGRYVKAAGRRDVDASLLALSTPYRVVAPEDPAMRATVAAIERDLRRGGGVHRYSGDTYYGGGEWVLLTAWLGWYYAEAGQTAQARELLAWVEAQADAEGNLPEQVPASLNDPAAYRPWLERWGEIARPLLWSNAKYLILKSVLNPT